MPFPQRSLQVLAYAALSSLFWAGCTSDSGVDGTSVDGAGGDGSNVGASAGGTGDTLQCTAPTVPCAEGSSTTCVDVEESAAHCGGCNQACPNGQVCLQGTCSVSAGTGGSPGSGGADPGPTGQGCGMPWDPSDAAVEEIRWLGHEALIARRTMMVAGEERSYLVAVPVDYDPNRAYPLIFGFHGSGGDREQLRSYMNVEIPAGGNAIVVYPEGLVLPDRGSTGWELGDESDDLTFVDQLYDKYTSELCVDLGRVFATGHSFGGCMSNTVGCFRGNLFRAVAPVAGCGPFSRAECVGQIASLQIHSSKDTSTGYSGAIQTCTSRLRANGCDESPECGCHWVDDLQEPEDECVQEAQGPYETEVPVETTERDDAPPVLRQYIGCDANYPVAFVDHWYREDRDGQDERWHNPPPWAGALIWEFFSDLAPIAPQ